MPSTRKPTPSAASSPPRRRPKAPISPLGIPPKILTKLRTIVVYGGSFDPPHFYHTVGPLSIIPRLFGPAGWLLYIPAARNPHKPGGPHASDAHRLAMLNVALDLPGQRSIWTDEIDRATWHAQRGTTSPSYTIDTLKRLRSILPASITLRLLIGSDQVTTFHKWKEPRQIVSLAEPLIMPREPNALVSSIYSSLDGEFWSRQEKADWCRRIAPSFPMPSASTDLRSAIPGAPARAAAWERRAPLRDVITPVAQYIIDHNLYGFRPGPVKAATPVSVPSGDSPGTMNRIMANVNRTLATLNQTIPLAISKLKARTESKQSAPTRQTTRNAKASRKSSSRKRS
jgi:nicotinate-nucleotide adenylyltransferase